MVGLQELNVKWMEIMIIPVVGKNRSKADENYSNVITGNRFHVLENQVRNDIIHTCKIGGILASSDHSSET